MQPELLEGFNGVDKPIRLISCTEPLRARSAETLEFIETGWKAVLARRPDSFNAQLLRVVRIENEDNGISVYVSPDISYKDVVGLRHDREHIQTVPQEELFQALTVMLEVTTADGDIVLLERDTGDWEHSLEFPGMFVRGEDTNKTEGDILNELLKKDLGVNLSESHSCSLHGILDFKLICETMLIYPIKLKCSTNKLRSSASKPLSVLPSGYTPECHSDFFSLPLHYPTSVVVAKMGETKL